MFTVTGRKGLCETDSQTGATTVTNGNFAVPLLIRFRLRKVIDGSWCAARQKLCGTVLMRVNSIGRPRFPALPSWDCLGLREPMVFFRESESKRPENCERVNR